MAARRRRGPHVTACRGLGLAAAFARPGERFLTPAFRLPPARIPSAGRFCSPLVSAIPASYTRA
ncbi:hypothetical protein FE789_02705 [Burkholderia pseudomallei]|nr:hypothetical protein FE789_02705 [Burkholderia pseudomallei]